MKQMEVRNGPEDGMGAGGYGDDDDGLIKFDFSIIDADESMMVNLDDYSNLEMYRQSSKEKGDDFAKSASASASAAGAYQMID